MTRLSELVGIGGARLVRDGSFSSLGFLTHKTSGRLAFLSDDIWLSMFNEFEGLAAVVTHDALVSRLPTALGIIVADDPRDCFYSIHAHLLQKTNFYGEHRESQIASTAQVHDRAFVSSQDVLIGERAIVEPNATIFSGVIVEDDAIVRAGVVLGSDGFQVVTSLGGAPRRIPHAGRVRIEKGAEVRATCCIDRALFSGVTRIGSECTIDHHGYIAHDVDIGERSLVGAGATINGSTTIGARCWIGPGATISGGLMIGSGAQVSLGSVVTRDVLPDQRVTGNFAIDHSQFVAWLRSIR